MIWTLMILLASGPCRVHYSSRSYTAAEHCAHAEKFVNGEIARQGGYSAGVRVVRVFCEKRDVVAEGLL